MDVEGFEPSERKITGDSEPSDAQLWMELKQGQMNALGILYDRHGSLVYAIALKTIKNPEDAEDITQDIFIKLAQTAYDPQRGSLRTFLAVLTRSRSIDCLRSHQRTQSLLEDEQLTPKSESTPVPEEILYREECAQEIRNALSQLSENQQRVLHLVYRDGLSHTAIAQQLNMPLGTVKSWARRGLIKLRESLEEIIGGED